jgi:hypothetical protein
MNKTARICAGVVLAVLAGYGVFYSACSALAYRWYHHAKYGASARDPNAIFRLCEAAHRLYPHNYYFSAWTAEQAYHGRANVTAVEAQRRLGIARYWCSIGLAENRFNSQLRLLKARLLQSESPAKAAEYWQTYVQWQFWDPYNHAVLVEFFVANGDLERAAEALKWVKGSPWYDWAAGLLREAWKQEWRTTAVQAVGGKRSKPPPP